MKKENQPSIPRAVKSHQTKNKIYQAAISLLQEYGYEYITINNICMMANISTGSFYHYFESKDMLMANFFAEAYEEYASACTSHTDNPFDDILELFGSYSDFCEKQGLDFIRHFYTPFNRSMDLKLVRTSTGAPSRPFMARAAEKIQAGVDSGYFYPDTNVNQTAEDLSTIEIGCVLRWCASDGAFHIRDMSKRLLGHFLSSYLTPSVKDNTDPAVEKQTQE